MVGVPPQSPPNSTRKGSREGSREGIERGRRGGFRGFASGLASTRAGGCPTRTSGKNGPRLATVVEARAGAGRATLAEGDLEEGATATADSGVAGPSGSVAPRSRTTRASATAVTQATGNPTTMAKNAVRPRAGAAGAKGSDSRGGRGAWALCAVGESSRASEVEASAAPGCAAPERSLGDMRPSVLPFVDMTEAS